MLVRPSLQVGVLLPTRGLLLRGETPPDLAPLLRMAVSAEEAGVDSLWVGDSLLAKPRLEPLVTLAALAMRTQRVGLGTAVLLAPFRQPVQLAQMAATVDLLSGGRLTLGLGVGGAFNDAQKAEWEALGIPPGQRGARMSELVQVCRRLWTEDQVDFHGRYFKLRDATLAPKPLQPGGVQLLLASHHRTGSDAQYRRAGLWGSGVMGITDSPPDYGNMLSRVRKIALAAGRDPDGLRTAFYMTININDSQERAFVEADDFIRRYYGLNFWADKWGPFGPPSAIANRMAEYAAVGASEIIVRFASLEPEAQLDTFIQEVLPLIRKNNL